MSEKRINRSPSELSREKEFHKRQHVKQNRSAARVDEKHKRKEDAKEKAKKLKNKKNQESKSRSTVMRVDIGLLGGILGLPTDFEGYIANLIRTANFGGADCDKSSAIFSPSLKAVTDLPIGLLTEKECMLPSASLPSGYTRILHHCRRMISIAQNERYIAYAVAGWRAAPINRSELRKADMGAQETALAHLASHARKLAQIEADHRSLFEAILCGRHKSALSLLGAGYPKSNLKPHEVRAVIEQHGLIYCMHDLQLIAARARKAEANPFESLVSSTMIQMKPENTANQSRRMADLLKTILAQYTTSNEELEGKCPLEDIPDPDFLQPLANELKNFAKNSGVDPQSFRPQIDDLVRFMRQTPVSENQAWRDILDQPISRNGLATSFNALWFPGLSVTQTVSVTILRYLQAERTICLLMDERDPRVECSLRAHTAMPPFDLGPKTKTSVKEAQDLLFMLRQEILQDKDFTGKDESVWNRKTRDGKAPIEEAAKKLKAWNQREMIADEGAHNDPRRTYYLLDVIPEHRLAH